MKIGRFCDLGGAAGSGWLTILPLSFLLFSADRARRKIWVWREVVGLLTETDAEDWPVAGSRTLSWCARCLNGRSGGPLD